MNNKIDNPNLESVLNKITENGFGRFGAMSNAESRSIVCAFLGLADDLDASSVIKQIQIRADEVGKLAEVQRRLVSTSWTGSVIEWDICEGYSISIVSEPLPSGRMSWNIVLAASNEAVRYDVILGAISKEKKGTTFRIMNVASKSEIAPPSKADPNEVLIKAGTKCVINAFVAGFELIPTKEDGSYDPVFDVIRSYDFKVDEGFYEASRDVTRAMLDDINCPAAFNRSFAELESEPVQVEEPKEESEEVPEASTEAAEETATESIPSPDDDVEFDAPSEEEEVSEPKSETSTPEESEEDDNEELPPPPDEIPFEPTQKEPEERNNEEIPSPDEVLPDGFGEEPGGEFPEDDEPEASAEDSDVTEEPEAPGETLIPIIVKGDIVVIKDSDDVDVFAPEDRDEEDGILPRKETLENAALNFGHKSGRWFICIEDIYNSSEYAGALFNLDSYIDEIRKCHCVDSVSVRSVDYPIGGLQRRFNVMYGGEAICSIIWLQHSDDDIISDVLLSGKTKVAKIEGGTDFTGAHPSLESLADCLEGSLRRLADEESEGTNPEFTSLLKDVRDGKEFEFKCEKIEDEYLYAKLIWKDENKETTTMKDIDEVTDPEPIGEIPTSKPLINTVMSADDFLRKLFRTNRPTILHVLTKLETYGKTADIYKLTQNYPTIQDIVYPDYTFSIVRMKNGAYYRIYVAHTIMEDLQNSCWEKTHNVEGRWMKIADVTDPKISAIENQRRLSV